MTSLEILFRVLLLYCIYCQPWCPHFPVVELANAIRFSTLSRMSGFLWHSSKEACRFSHFLQYTPGLEVLACSLNTNLNYLTAMLQLYPSLNHYLSQSCGNFKGEDAAIFWVHSHRYATPACRALSWT